MHLRRFAATLLGALVLLGVAAPVAAADPAKPSNYESRVLTISPRTGAFTLKVVGGDGFLDLHVKPGHVVTVPGYEGEPWLKVTRDGHVLENQLSQATYVNASRYGSTGNVTIPPGVNAQAATKDPQWAVVARRGTYVWHDHRIHWMSPDQAPTLVPGTNRVAFAGPGGTWQIPMTADGKPVMVTGELLKLSPPNPLASWLVVVGIVVLTTVVTVLRRTLALPLAFALVALGGVAGTFAGFHELAVVPPQAGGNPVDVGLPIAALVAVLAALVLRNRATRVIILLAGAAALVAWGVLRIPAFSKALPLSDLGPTTARLLIAVVLGSALGGAVAAVGTGALALSPADLDEEDDGEPVGDEGPGSGAVPAAT